MEKNDSFLWNRLKNGDKQSFEIVFKIYYPQLCLFANQYTKDFDIAREVVQDLFVYLWENRDRLQEKESIKAYLHTAVRFNSIRRFNDQKRRPLEILEVPEDALAIDFLDEAEYAELQEAIFQAIESLPPKCREIFKMSRFEQKTYTKIAGEMNISVKTVEAQMSKAIRHIQKSFDEYLLFIILALFV